MTNNEEPKLSDLLNFGQGDDDIILRCTEAINKMLEGFYTLDNYSRGQNSSKWWLALNRSTFHDSIISEQWAKIDWDVFMDSLWTIQIVMNGEYIKSDKFVEALKKMKELGYGYRPNSKENIDDRNNK